MPETPYFKRILEHSSNYADINKKRSEWDLNPRARKRTTAFRVRLVMTTSIRFPVILLYFIRIQIHIQGIEYQNPKSYNRGNRTRRVNLLSEILFVYRRAKVRALLMIMRGIKWLIQHYTENSDRRLFPR